MYENCNGGYIIIGQPIDGCYHIQAFSDEHELVDELETCELAEVEQALWDFRHELFELAGFASAGGAA